MSSKDQLREEIKAKAVVHGKVILSSGKEADYYVDLRRVTLDHVAAPLIGEVMLDLTKDWDYDAVGGLTLGADPVATAMMHVAAKQGKKLDAFVVRKAEKAHGLQRRIEGPDVKGKKVLAVEDTSTTGGSVLTGGGASPASVADWKPASPKCSARMSASVLPETCFSEYSKGPSPESITTLPSGVRVKSTGNAPTSVFTS